MRFEDVASRALTQSGFLLTAWLPGGELEGREYCCGSLRGEPGKSLKVNMDTGKWCDFATGDKGGDLVSLYAAINNLKQSEAKLQVAKEIGYENGAAAPEKAGARMRGKTTKSLIPPPKGARFPTMTNKKLGDPSEVYRYHDEDGQVLFLIARYDLDDGSKEMRPWSYREDGRWVSQGWKAPRPLYNLHTLGPRVLIVEGEKAANAAAKFSEKYSVVTWPGGSNAVDKVNWTPLFGRDVLIWPDHDEPGRLAAAAIGKKLLTHCKTVKIINTQDMEWDEGYDAADVDFTWDEFCKWAKPRAKFLDPSIIAPQQEPEVEMPPVPAELIETPMPSPDEDPEANVNVYVGDDAISALNFQVSPNANANIERIGLAKGKNAHRPYMNHDNILRILAADFKGHIWFDEFYLDVFTDMFDETRSWVANDDTSLAILLQRSYGMVDITPQKIGAAVKSFAQFDRRHQPRDWFSSIKWDKTERLSQFFQTYMQAKDSEYIQAVSRNFFVSMVARVMKPGSKADHMVVIEGPQGSYKSSALDIIGGAWYVAQSQSAQKGNEFNMCMNGSILVELPEMASFDGVRANTIKDTLSRRMDRYRAPYDTKPRDWPRQSIFVGTTNDDEYLDDPTGGRRYWPVRIGSIDLKKLEDDREQLFAEAVHLYKTGHKWYEVPSEAAKLEQMKRYEGDAWTDKVLHYAIGRSEIDVSEIAEHGLNIEIGRVDRKAQMRIASILKQSGFEKKTVWRDGKTTRVWANPYYDKTETQPPLPKHVIKNYAPDPGDFR